MPALKLISSWHSLEKKIYTLKSSSLLIGGVSIPSCEKGKKVHKGKTSSIIKETERGFFKVISTLRISKNKTIL